MMVKFSWSKFRRGVFLVNCLAIVYNPKTGKILIGKRDKDPYVKKLSWAFPGGRPGYSKDLEHYLKLEVKKKTNLDIKIKRIIFARSLPENRKFLLLYYLAEPINAGKEKAGEKFKEIKWIKPTDVKKFFTTSIHPEIMKILRKLK
jgi:ADP-ribose pyrophosphatase YjhB (NUDIX family)